jgi:peptidoglycan hydrolase-like protein with peptidoglycan-binding domain
MKRKKQIFTAALLSASIGVGTQSALSQIAPGPSTEPTNPRGPVFPQPQPNLPRETEPIIPGRPAPGIPQTGPLPGQPGTIPEKAQRPSAGDQNMMITPDDIKKAQDALRAKGLNPGTGGRLDSQTQQALREFQKSNDLPATGVLDDRTAGKLGVSKSKNSDLIPERGSSLDRSDSSLPKPDGPRR